MSIVEDIGVDAVKVGMLFNVPVIHEVAKCLRQNKVGPVVLDPVMFAKSGDRLLQEEAVESVRQELLPLATVVTPNIPEAEALLGRSIESAMEQAAIDLCEMGPQAVVVKGGALTSGASDDCFLVKGGPVQWLRQQRIDTQNVHGTGCTFSSAIAAYLAQSYTLEDAVREAKKYLTAALTAGAETKLGHGKGPVMHFYKTWKH